ncbi:hypothetical protein M0R04_12375 [Candidatus Dojkabacteria bacterium]|jgi:hypothetical protein|nr:hypothetical protein [Candidatus Dojkabacteria bacterium]
MAVIIDCRNPQDLVTTYDSIHIQSATAAAFTSPTDVVLAQAIDQTTASDLSTGYTSYTDANGTVGTTYYRFRYKNSSSGVVSSYSEIFLAGGSVLQTRFRRMMKDTNSNNYFYSTDDLDFFEVQAVQRLYPTTWFETYTDTGFVPDNTTEIFNFPIGVTRITGVDFLDSSGNNLGRLVNYNVRGRMLIFDTAPRTGITLRVWTEKMFLKMAEVPEIWDSHLLNIMMLQAYQMLEGNRTLYYKYNSVVSAEGGNLPSIGSIITRLEAQIQRREAQLRRSRKPAFIKLV